MLDIITQRFSSLNLRINYDKCVILADSQTLLDQVDCADDPALSRIKTTTEGIKLLGAAISKSPEFQASHVQEVIDEAYPVLRAITEFGQTHLQQALALLRASYMSKFSYLTRVTPPDVVSPFLNDILSDVKKALQDKLSQAISDAQWGQCLLKPRLGGIGIIDIANTATGAYYASVLSCLPAIAKVDEVQKLGINAAAFDSNGLPLPSNQFGDTINTLYGVISQVYDAAMEVDRDLSLHVLDSLPTEPDPRPGAITPPDKEERIRAVNALAATPLPPPRDLMNKSKKLQSLFSDKVSRVNRHRLMQHMDPEDIIRIHSASDEGAAIIQARPTSPNTSFQTLEFKVLLFLRLGIPIAAADVNCSHCAAAQLSNRHLVNGCPHKNYKHRKHKAIMTEIVELCTAADILVAEEQFQCFKTRTSRRMDLVFKIDSTEFLVDVTTIDAKNPSNGFLRGSGLAPAYFPGAAAVMKAKHKWDRYRFLMKNSQQQLVPFVLEVQGRWGHCARQLFKRIFSKIPIAANRVSRNFWAQRITLAHARCVASNIVHRFHTMKKHVFGPSAPQQVYYFEPYFGQVLNPAADSLPS